MNPLVHTWILRGCVAAILGTAAYTAKACEGVEFSIGVGKNTTLFGQEVDWLHENATAAKVTFGYNWKYIGCGVTHISHYDVGPPTKDEFEQTVDFVGCDLNLAEVFSWNSTD